jgi:molecular chaperone GrpE
MMIEQKNQTDNNIETTVDNIEQNSDSNQDLISETEDLNSPFPETSNVSSEDQEVTTKPNEGNPDQSLNEENEEIVAEVISPETDFSSPVKEAESTSPSESLNLEEESVTTPETTLPTESESKVNYDEVIAVLQAEISKVTEQLEQEKQQHSSLKAQYARIVADFENFRRRTEKEKKEMEQQTKKKTISELLPVVDNFERARTQIKPANDGEMAIHKSYQGVYKNFVDSLKKIGVAAMRPEGKPFDPNYHEAMLRESTTEYEDGIVIEQLVRGYWLNDEVIRHAMVKVAIRDTQPQESEPQDQDSSFTENS